jgi:gliding motility-associated-like protein
MNKTFTLVFLFFLSLFSATAQTTVDCAVGPETENFCYTSNNPEQFDYVSSDGSALNLTINSGNVEQGWDEFIVLDSDGTELYNGYGNNGNLAGLTFQSSGDSITIQVTPDGSIDCGSSANINPIDFTVACATCVNPQVSFDLIDDCLNAPQFFVEANVTDLGSATDLDITDNQGSPAQTVSSTGVVSFGPYPNGTLVTLTVENNQDPNCQVVSAEFTQDNCTTNLVDCTAGPVNTVFCYDSNILEEFTYVSSDGSSLNLVINSGNVEQNWDEFIVIDSDGTELYNGYGNGGDLSGFSFQSSGDTITIQVTPDGSISCQSSTGINPIDITVSCATCTNPQANFQLVDDCVNAPQFFVEANVTDLGSATDLDITDNQGSPAQTVSATGVVSFGPYPNGTLVTLTVENNQDPNCQVISQEFTQDVCTTTVVDCAVGPENLNFCYDSGVPEEFTFVSSDGSPLNLVVNSGNVENNFDEFIVLDTNGTELFNGYGNGGDLSGLNFQSTGDTIVVQVTPDGSVSCQSSTGINPIDITVSCATCTNPLVSFQLVDDCVNAPQFFVEADVTDLGSATDLDITDNQGSPAQTVSAAGVVSFGPYPNGTIVELTVVNNQDVNCQVVSEEFTQDVCTTTVVDCAVGPANLNFCYDSGVPEEFTFVSSDGSPLNLIVNSGNVENNFDEFIVLDTNGTELFNGYGNAGDLSGLSFQSTGDTIVVQVTPDGSIDCQGSAGINPIDITVSCATCVNPQVEYFVVGECDNGNEEFSVDVEIIDIGSASSLDITNNQGDPLQNVTAPTTLTYGPYPLGTDVVFTVENVDDVNCILTSSSQTLETCGCFGSEPFCAPGPGEALIFPNVDDSSNTEADPNLSNYGCLFTQPNPVWYFMQIEDSGELVFEIVQNTSFDANGNPNGQPLDVDFIAWGPFTDIDFCNNLDSCDNCGSNTFDNNYPYGNVVDCSYSAAPVETFTIPNAQAGEIYAVLITNFNGDPGFISLGQTNSNDQNSGSTNCDIVLQNQIIACNGDDIELTASDENADQYQWLVFNETTQQFDPIAGETTQTTTVTEAGVYQILTLNGTDVSTEEFTVELIPEPEHNLPQQISICGNASITLDGALTNLTDYDSVSYQWFLDGNILQGEIQATLDVTQPGTYSAEISTTTENIDVNGNDLTCVTTVDVLVTSADFTVDLGGNQNICPQDQTAITTINATITVGDPANATYLWSTNETTPSIDVTETGTYEVTVTIDGCPVTESVVYTFAEEPQFDLGDDQTLCENETTTLDATVSNSADFTSISYEWSDANGIIAGENSGTLEVSAQGTYTVEVTTTTTNADGVEFTCTDSDSIEIDTIEFTVDLGDSQQVCHDDPTSVFTINAVVNGFDDTNATYLWSTNETTPSIDVTETGTYEVTVSIDSCSVTESVVYTFAEDPVFDLGADQNLCEGETTILDATVSNANDFTNITYEWSDADGIISGETQSTLNVSSIGTYSVEVTTTTTTANGDSFTCTETDTITINGAVFTVDLGQDQVLCDAGPQTITAEVDGADDSNATYLWSTNKTTQSISVTESGVYEVTVIIENCPVTTSVEYTFNERPVIALGPDTETCDLTMFPLDATPSNLGTNNVTYEWSLDGNPLNNNSATLNPDDFGFGTYEVNVYFDDPDCNTTDNITFNLRNIGVTITSDDIDNTFCIDETVTFSAGLQNADVAEADFEWFINDAAQNVNSSTLENFQITSSQMSQTVRVEVTIGTECFVSAEQTFSLYDIDNCVISQGLSPNDDGDNDNLDLRFLDDRSDIVSFDVFNRYGQNVYSKENYRDEFIGQSDNGNMLETGTYFYVIKFANEDPQYGRVHKGWIYINREQ